MASASENQFLVRRAREMLRELVGNGAAAMTEANTGIALLRGALEKFEGSRAHALQELGEINQVLDIVRVIASGTQNPVARNLIEYLEQAREKVEKYVNALNYRILNLRDTIAAYQGITNILDDSGHFIQATAQDLEEYETYL